MDLVLIRHGLPERIDNSDEPADPNLTQLGRRQAEAMADWLSAETFDALYVSPMARARQTSSPLEAVTGLAATVVDGVQEFDAAERSYIPIEDLKADKERWKAYLMQDLSRDMTEFSDIVVDSLEKIIADHRGHRVGVVCHGGVVNIWAAKVLGLGPSMFFNPHYTSINRFAAASTGERSLVSLNEVAHLRALAAHRPDHRL